MFKLDHLSDISTVRFRMEQWAPSSLQALAFGRSWSETETGTSLASPTVARNLQRAWAATQVVTLALLTVDVCGSPSSDVGAAELNNRDVGNLGYKLCSLPVEGEGRCSVGTHPGRRDSNRVGLVIRGPKPVTSTAVIAQSDYVFSTPRIPPRDLPSWVGEPNQPRSQLLLSFKASPMFLRGLLLKYPGKAQMGAWAIAGTGSAFGEEGDAEEAEEKEEPEPELLAQLASSVRAMGGDDQLLSALTPVLAEIRRLKDKNARLERRVEALGETVVGLQWDQSASATSVSSLSSGQSRVAETVDGLIF